MLPAVHLLFYDYVPDILERRAPHRQAHLALVAEWHAAGRIVIAGAVGEPPHGALFVFTDAADAEAFAAQDPYGDAGLVTERRLEPWTVVTPLPT
jgi:uncharacterized protein